MATKKNKFDFASDEQKKKYINEIIAYFQDERGEEIGYLAAEQLLEFFTETFGKEIYLKGINDCKKLIKEKAEDLEVELNMLGSNG